MEMNFCRRCGTALTNSSSYHVYRCENGHTLFLNASPSVGVFLLNPDGKLLLSVRGIEPRKGMLDAFGGFLEGEETLDAAIARELREELGLESSDYTSPVFLTSAIGHYPYGDEAITVLSSLFYAHLLPGVTPQPSDDVAEIRQVDINKLDISLLHDDDIREGIRKLKALL